LEAMPSVLANAQQIVFHTLPGSQQMQFFMLDSRDGASLGFVETRLYDAKT